MNLHVHHNIKGFTLIELLVVISVIGMLSSVLMLPLQAARAKARNSYTIQTIRQYTTAIEFLRDSDAKLPLVPGGTIFCLGAPVSNQCLGQTLLPWIPYLNFNTLIAPYYASTPTPNPRKTDSPLSPGSFLRVYPVGGGYTQVRYGLEWTMEKQSDPCVIPGAVKTSNPFDSNEYSCVYIIPNPGPP